MASSGGFAGAFLGGLGGGAIGSAVVRLYLDSGQYEAGLAKAKGQTATAGAQMGTTASKFSAMWATAGVAAGAALAKFSVDSVKAAIEQQQAQAKLANAITNTGNAAAFSIDGLNAQAAALRDTTGASDEAINGAQALLIQMGLTQDQVTELTPLINDLSVKMGIDLTSASKAVGKAALGTTGALARYVGPIVKGTTAAETYANVLQKLGAVQGFAAEQAKIEPWRILSEQFNEFQEQVGNALLPALQKMTEVLTPIAQKVLPELGDAIVNVLGPIGDMATAIDDIANHKMPDFGSAAAGLLKVISLFNPAYKDAADIASIYANAQDDAATATGNVTNKVTAYGPKVTQTADAVYRWGSDLAYANGFLGANTKQVLANGSAMEKAKKDTIAYRDALLSLAGGVLGIVTNMKSLRADQAELNRLQNQGKEGTKAYRDAQLQVLQDQLALTQSLRDQAQEMRKNGTSVSEIRQKLVSLGVEAGLSKNAVRSLIDDALGPLASKVQTTKTNVDDLRQSLIRLNGTKVAVDVTTNFHQTGNRSPFAPT